MGHNALWKIERVTGTKIAQGFLPVEQPKKERRRSKGDMLKKRQRNQEKLANL